MKIGFRVAKRNWKAAPELIERFRELPVANISDVMNRMRATAATLRPYHDGSVLCGQALTVSSRPGDNLMVHKALHIAQHGDVLVVDAGGELTNAIVGEFMVDEASRAGVAGLVIDGAIRDVASIRAGSMPVYAAGVTHRGPYKDGPGEINVTVSVGGMVVQPGDIIVGDEDGVLAIPLDHAKDVLEAALAKQAAEKAQWDQVRAGTRDYSWIDEALRRKGCLFE